MSPARTQERRDVSPILIPLGVILGGLALWFGLPGLLLIWLALVIAGLAHPAPAKPKTSEKDDPWVEETRLRHQFYTTVGYTLIAPNKGWGFGWPPLYSFFAAVFLAAAAYQLPQFHHSATAEAIHEWATPVAQAAVWFPLVNAVAALLICLGLSWARRRTMDAEEVCPGTRISDAVTVAKSKPHLVIGPGVLGAVAAVIAAPVVADISQQPQGIVLLVSLAAGVLAGTYPAARHQALTHWREVLEHRRAWRDRFKAIKKEPAPRVADLERLGREESTITVLHFISNAAVGGSDWFLKNPDKLAATVGGSTSIAVAPVEQTDSKGQPKPGTVDAVKFDIIELPSSEAVPSLGSSETDDKTTEQLLRAVFAQASAHNSERFMPTGHEVITSSASRVLRVSVSGIDVKSASKMLPEFSAVIGADVVADPEAGALYMGQFDGAEFTAESGVTEDTIQYLLKADWWNQRWADAIKKAENPPKPEWKTEASGQLADGTEVNSLVFVIRRGMTPEKDFFPFEHEIATALESYPFVSMTGFRDPRASRPGERHRQAVSLRWAQAAVPDSIEAIAGVPRSKAPEWVLAAALNRGFADAKLARPELAGAEPISTNDSPKHLWQMHVRLYGGTTLSDIRKKQHQLMESWGVDYLRVAETRDGVKIIAGADPETVEIRDSRAWARLAALEWEQIFIDSGIKSESGTMPQLMNTTEVEENPKVRILTFSLRSTGLALEAFTARVPKLKANSGNAFIQPRPASTGKPNEIDIVVCEDDPMPFPAEADYAEADRRTDLPFAVDVYGRTVAYDPRESPHLLVVGATGSGKSVSLQYMLYSALLRGWECYIADPSKGGTDYFFAEDYYAGLTGEVHEASGMMRHLYEEVTRRKALNTEYKVSKVSELPEEVRPARILVLLDEFTSLMMQEKPPERSENPEADAAREDVVRLNNEKQTIGFLTGKIAREARSAEVTLILATQKLDAKTLDRVPGSQDLKDLTLDTPIPVPISVRFPTGWTVVGELEEGDHVYAPDGMPTPIMGLSDIYPDNDLYEVEFDDGQIIKAGADHGWLVSSEWTRKEFARVRRYGEGRNREARVEEWVQIRAFADSCPSGLILTADDLVKQVDFLGSGSVEKIARDRGVPAMIRSYLTGEFIEPDTARRRGKLPTLFFVDDVIDALRGSNVRKASALDPYRSSWATPREIEAITRGLDVNRAEAYACKKDLLRRGLSGREVSHQPLNYDARKLAEAVSEHLLDKLGRHPNDSSRPLAREFVVTTRQMAEGLRGQTRGRKNWAVENSFPIDGSDADLIVEPYVLGLWLGDGHSASAVITSSITDVDDSGTSDQQHAIRELRMAGYEANQLHADPKLIGVRRGLKRQLAELGVANNKHIPSQYLRASFAQRLCLLQGLLDSDGTVTVNGRASFTQNAGELLFNVRELVESLGIKVGEGHQRESAYRLNGVNHKTGNTSHSISFATKLPVFRLPRKLVKLKRNMGGEPSTRRMVVDVRQVESEPTRCITVAHPSHLFLAGRFVPTHNSNLSRAVLGNSTLGDRQSALRSPYDAPDLGDSIPPGRGLWEPLTAPRAEAIQSWFDPEEQNAYRRELAKRLDPWPEEDRPDWRTHVRDLDETPTVRRLDDDQPVAVEQDLGEMDFDIDFDDAEDEDTGVAPESDDDETGDDDQSQSPARQMPDPEGRDSAGDPDDEHDEPELEVIEVETVSDETTEGSSAETDGQSHDMSSVVAVIDDWLGEHSPDAPGFEVNEFDAGATVEVLFEPCDYESTEEARELALGVAELLGRVADQNTIYDLVTVVVAFSDEADDEVIADFDRSTIDGDNDGLKVRLLADR